MVCLAEISFGVRERGVGYIAMSRVMEYSWVFYSSGIGSLWATKLSIYSSIASFAIEIASSMVSP